MEENQNISAEKIPFEELIRGQYREDFQKKVSEILRKRLKNRQDSTANDREDGYRRLLASAEEARRVYPGLDLRQELQSRRFADLVLRGVDVRTAYDAAHRDEILQGAMAYAARQAAEKLARAKMSRPPENGFEGRSAVIDKVDPQSLSAEERAEIRRRVLERGERVTF